MSAVFITRTWGSIEPQAPLLTFNSRGNRNASLGQYRPGDWVLVVGTDSAPTAPEHRGRMLCLCQLASHATEDDVEPLLKERGVKRHPEHYDADGNYRWPYGVGVSRVDEVDGLPLFKDVLPDHNNRKAMSEVNQIQRLTDDEAAAVLNLSTTEVKIVVPESIAAQSRTSELLRGGTGMGTGPAPAERTKPDYRDVDWNAPASVYLMELRGQFGKPSGFKVGFSNDVDRRLKQFNTSPVAVLGGQRMELVMSQPFSTANLAYDIEQAIHRKLQYHSVGYECYAKVNRKDIERVFTDTILEYR